METLVTFRNYVDFLRHVNIVFIVVHVLSIAITLLRRLILVSRFGLLYFGFKPCDNLRSCNLFFK